MVIMLQAAKENAANNVDAIDKENNKRRKRCISLLASMQKN